MSTNFAIIGGDLRMIKLAKMLAQEGKQINTYGLEKAEELKEVENIIFCEKIDKAFQEAKIVIGPIPFSKDGLVINSPFSQNSITVQEFIKPIKKDQIIIAGSMAPEVYELAKDSSDQMVDIMKREELAILNAISTAEGAIELMLQNTNQIIHGSHVLILGFGRIAKVLAKKLQGLSVNVTCAARKKEDLAWIKAYGYHVTNINELGENLQKYDIIVNTVPHLLLTQEKLQYIKQECLLMDVSSKPGGMDQEEVKRRNLKFIWGLALPR